LKGKLRHWGLKILGDTPKMTSSKQFSAKRGVLSVLAQRTTTVISRPVAGEATV